MRLALTSTIALLLGTLLVAPAQESPRALEFRRLSKKNLIRKSQALPSPTALLERLAKLSPEEREAVFAQVPEVRRDQVRRRFDAFNRLTPEERERLGENLIVFVNMPPQRQEVARAIFRRFAAQPADRQKVMHDEIKVMSSLSPEDRRSRVNTDEFRNRFSAGEKVLMFDLVRMFPGKRNDKALDTVQQQQQQ